MFLVSGIPRASTTLVAKLISLTPGAFCYAGETHVVSFLHNYFQHFPCKPQRVDDISKTLAQQLTTTLLEAPRYGVSQGAHPGNLIFNEQHVEELTENIRESLRAGLFGARLFEAGLSALQHTLRSVSDREFVGEKTPDSIFAISAYADTVNVQNLAVVREPLGVIRSMAARVAGGDPFSNVFGGGIESNIGIYLDYASAVLAGVEKGGSQLVRFEDLAMNPREALIDMYSMFGITPEEDVLAFSEAGGDQKIADRAPMYYQRLKVKTDFAALTETDIWKVVHLTRDVRNAIGYDDAAMRQLGFELPVSWPGPDNIPAALVPMSGFNEPDLAISRLWKKQSIGCWMKGNARLLVYLPDRKPRKLQLNFGSHYPQEVLGSDQACLTASIGGAVKDRATVSVGAQTLSLTVDITEKDHYAMGNTGACAMVELSPSHVYCPMVHLERSWDQRLVSFHLRDWRFLR